MEGLYYNIITLLVLFFFSRCNGDNTQCDRNFQRPSAVQRHPAWRYVETKLMCRQATDCDYHSIQKQGKTSRDPPILFTPCVKKAANRFQDIRR